MEVSLYKSPNDKKADSSNKSAFLPKSLPGSGKDFMMF
ncbi:hypothetical protein BAOM_3889 [Peribacillus asahii]|uniref:Uncharacterized protein n=1 Tax=Peribacillus asahii TaxID=228899 RepID=A0A3Q9RQQ1_9BACI|nr:hypothetical protein BAOM_3889 [Peribacillus asahii]